MNRMQTRLDVLHIKNMRVRERRFRIPNVLLPVYHTTAAAQIEVTIDEEGNFLGAEQVSQEDKLTVIPVTEKPAAGPPGRNRIRCATIFNILQEITNYMSVQKEKAGRAMRTAMKPIWMRWKHGIFRSLHIPKWMRSSRICKKELW